MPTLSSTVTCPIHDSFHVQQVAGMFDVPLRDRAVERFHVDIPDGLLLPSPGHPVLRVDGRGAGGEGGQNDPSPRPPLSPNEFEDVKASSAYPAFKLPSPPAPLPHSHEYMGGRGEIQTLNFQTSNPRPPLSYAPRPWRIGLIVGPSGSGKTTIARRMFGENLYRSEPWADDRAVVDGLGDLPIKEITGLFTAVGFSSPPSWIKPFQVLSGGEQFRCDLARALARVRQAGATIAFDEYTSVVDRNVARVTSAAIAKALQTNLLAGRLVAVTCHYDIAEWLQPDWIIDMATSTFQWRCLRRPPIDLEIVRCTRGAWPLFARHHYLSGELSAAVQCFLALWNREPVAFCASLTQFGQKNFRRLSRIVTLPDYQGIGIGMRLAECVADLHAQEGKRVGLTASHPAVIAHCRRSPHWRTTAVKKHGTRGVGNYCGSAGRAVVSFQYSALPSPAPVPEEMRERAGGEGG